jgi:hypothetical protein
MISKKIGITELRKASQLGPFSMLDFAMSYLVVIVIWVIGLIYGGLTGLTLIGMLLSVIPLAILSHLFISSDGPKLDSNTKRTAMTDMFLSTKLNFGSVAVKAVTIGSTIGAAVIAYHNFNKINKSDEYDESNF